MMIINQSIVKHRFRHTAKSGLHARKRRGATRVKRRILVAENIVNLKKDIIPIADKMRADIMAVALKASDDDRAQVDDLIAEATQGEFTSKVVVITPPMAALLFLHHNDHNRDWRPEGAKSTTEYARRMSNGQWRKNNASVGFYVDGKIEDGQHRLAAAAIALYTLQTVVSFGITRDAITTVDDGLARHGSDHAKLFGTKEAKAKQKIIDLAASYWTKAGKKDAKIKSAKEQAEAITVNDETLIEAMELGKASLANIVDPVLKEIHAQTLAYLMLQGHWPAQRIREKMALFQTGVDNSGEDTPYFRAGKLIKKSREKRDNRDKLSNVKELGIAIYAMAAAEKGIKAIGDSTLKGAVKKELPSPLYPEQAAQAA